VVLFSGLSQSSSQVPVLAYAAGCDQYSLSSPKVPISSHTYLGSHQFKCLLLSEDKASVPLILAGAQKSYLGRSILPPSWSLNMKLAMGKKTME
jgi:hypothetical protein